PLKYGFVYNGYWWGEIVYWLPPEVYADTGFLEALNELKTSLDKIPKSPVETSTVDYQINEDDVEEPFSADVSDVSEDLKESTVEPQVAEDAKISGPAPGSATKSVFAFENPSWDDSKLASAVLFLQEFCKEVKAEKFNGRFFDKSCKGLSNACSSAYIRLQPFTWNLLGDAKENPYKDALTPEKLEIYVEWLVDNIPEFMESIISMHNESRKYSEQQLKARAPVVLSKYGFVFRDGWNAEIAYPWSSPDFAPRKLIEAVITLRTTLERILRSFLKTSSEGSEDSIQTPSQSGLVSENPEDSSVESKIIENPSHDSSTLKVSKSSSEPSPDDASTQEIKAILEQLPDSNVNSFSGGFYAPKKPFNVEVPDIYEDPEMLSMECRISDPEGGCVYVPSKLYYLRKFRMG
ncbi:secreted antigen 1, partial [Babesia divergens]